MAERYAPIYTEMALIATTVGTTFFKFSTTNYVEADKVYMTLTNSALSYTFASTEILIPTTTVGHQFAPSSQPLTLYGRGEIFSFKAVAASTTVGSTGAVLFITGYKWIG